MGRTLKRVALDFDWPLNKIWKGYWNPYYCETCPVCEGHGYNKETKALNDAWYNHNGIRNWVDVSEHKRYDANAWHNNLDQDDVQALIDNGRLREFTIDNSIPTAEEVNEWSRKSLMGHDGLSCFICVEARAKRLGFYGLCSHCNGYGNIYPTEKFRELADNYENFEPPTGEGYQLWNTTTEGHPMSPVFNTLDDLCEWCEVNATTFGREKATKEEWKSMLDEGFVRHEEGNCVFI